MVKTIGVLLICGVPVVASAQDSTASGRAGDVLRQALGQFNTVCCGNVRGTDIAGLIGQQLAVETATVPSGTSGFAVTIDGQGHFVRSGGSLMGSTFVEQPGTSGRGHWNISLSYQQTTYQALDGVNLSNGDLFAYREGIPSYRDVFEFIDLKTSTTVIGVTAGVTSRLDLGVQLPIQTVSVGGHVDSSASGGSGGLKLDGASSGFGDAVIHAKWGLWHGGLSEGALSNDLRLPTGDETQLLGGGHLQDRIAFLIGLRGNAAAINAVTGYQFGGQGIIVGASATDSTFEPSRTWDIGVSGHLAIGHLVAFEQDVLGRVLFDSASLQGTGATVASQITFGTGGWTNIVADTRSMWRAVSGVKVRVTPGWLLTARALYAVNSVGLKPGVSPVLGIERSF